LGHDILFQFAGHHKISFDEANLHFRYWLEEEKFELAEIYYDAVDTLGQKFWKKDESLIAIYL